MRLNFIKTVFIFIVVSQSVFAQTNQYQKVQYLSGTIQDVSEDVIELLDGSKWLASYSTYILPLSEVIIVYDVKNNSGTVYIDGDEIFVKHLSGHIILNSGYLTYVIKEYGEGAILVTEDGSFWEVPEYDRYDSGYWLPPYKVVITSNELYMYNLNENKKIWIKRASE